MEFHPYTLEAAVACRPYFSAMPDRFCDWTVAGIYMWKDYYSCQYTITNGCLISVGHGEDGVCFFSVPLGDGDRDAALTALEAHCDAAGIPLRFATVSPADTAWLVERYGSTTQVIATPDAYDYLYNFSDLATLAGRRYSRQRNHIHQFEKKNPTWQYLPLTSEWVPAVERFLQELLVHKQSTEPLPPTELADITAALEVLSHMEELSLTGGILTVEGLIAGISIGEVQGDTLYVHIEKGNLQYPGIYQMLVREYAAHTAAPGLLYINREDDAGDEGLRRSKRSYHPCALLEKYLVIPERNMEYGNHPCR